MKTLILGSSGYIGSRLCERFNKKGIEVVGVDQYAPSKEFKGLFNLKKLISLRAIDFEGIDTVIHLAALTPTRFHTPKEYYDANVGATRHALISAKQAGVKQYLYASSTATLGSTTYGESKLTAERIIFRANSDSMNAAIIRIGNTYGYSPNMRWDTIINNIVDQGIHSKKIDINESPSSFRPIIFLDDVCDAFIWMAENRKLSDMFYLVEKNYQIIDLITTTYFYLRQEGYKVEFGVKENGYESYMANGKEFRNLSKLKFNSLDKGLKKFLKELKKK